MGVAPFDYWCKYSDFFNNVSLFFEKRQKVLLGQLKSGIEG
jgi:hypothetical protein